MGGGTEDQDRKDGSKGFAGLSSLVSDVDATVSEADRNPKALPHAADREATRTTESQTSSPSSEPSPAYQPPPQPSGGGSTGKWIAGIAVVVGLIWLASLSDKRTPSTSPTYTPAPESQSAPSTTPAWQPPSPAVQQSNRPTEEPPPVGNGLSLSMPQLRYCTAENIRLDAAKVVISSYSDTDIDRFNALVADYNSRCGQFRYRRGTLESAQSEVEQHRSEIEVEGRARFSRAPATVTSTDRLPEIPVAKPDFTVQAIQRRLNEFGYDAGQANGFAGEQTRAAISAFQREVHIIADGNPSLELLKSLSEHIPLSQSSTSREERPERSTAPNYNTGPRCTYSTECAGSNQCLDGQCRPARSGGERCSYSSECSGANQCLDGQCRPARSGGERCSYSSECSGANQCLDGQCRPARSGGERCSYSSECSGANQCLDGQCRPPRVAGERCSYSSECGGINECVLGKCQRPQ